MKRHRRRVRERDLAQTDAPRHVGVVEHPRVLDVSAVERQLVTRDRAKVRDRVERGAFEVRLTRQLRVVEVRDRRLTRYTEPHSLEPYELFEVRVRERRIARKPHAQVVDMHHAVLAALREQVIGIEVALVLLVQRMERPRVVEMLATREAVEREPRVAADHAVGDRERLLRIRAERVDVIELHIRELHRVTKPRPAQVEARRNLAVVHVDRTDEQRVLKRRPACQPTARRGDRPGERRRVEQERCARCLCARELQPPGAHVTEVGRRGE